MSKLTEVSGRHVLRGNILHICYQSEPVGAGTEVITAALKKEGFTFTKNEVLEACRYLSGKSLIDIRTVKNDILNISRDIAHITPKGIDVLEGTETVEGIEL